MSRCGACLLLMLMTLWGSRALGAAGDAAALYNQGNEHARAQEWGLAVLDYQRARLLAPADADIQANLQYVRAAAKVSVAAPTLPERIARLSSPDIAAGLGLLGLMFIGGALWSRGWIARMTALFLGASLVAFTAAHALGLRPLLQGAVVVGGPAPVQASPVPMADTLSSLPEASSVVILAERADYLLVALPGRQSGWIARDHLMSILPAGGAVQP